MDRIGCTGLSPLMSIEAGDGDVVDNASGDPLGGVELGVAVSSGAMSVTTKALFDAALRDLAGTEQRSDTRWEPEWAGG